jgi:hypothetical protein
MVTYERLRELLDYDPETGVFRWKIYRNGRAKVGYIAGGFDKCGHRRIAIDGRFYPSHRLAWLYQTGKWPVALIDHINMVPDDNRFCNLREATKSQNGWNTGKRSDNTSGFKGVTWAKNVRRWMAQIQVHGKNKHLGTFDTPEQAHAAYAAAAKEFHGEFARVDR